MIRTQTRRTAFVVVGLLLMPMFTVFVSAENVSRDLKECSVRKGLPNFFSKLKKDSEVKIAYLGGSITAQNGWRVYSREWFQEKYSKARVKEINAAIGGTGSSLGVFRNRHDVLRFKPDLVFVEFAVNDAKASPKSIRSAFEGIIRQTWKSFPDCDICFVYTVTYKDEANLKAGKMKRSASIMESVADYYGIPSVHMGVEIAELAKAGKLKFKSKKGEMIRVSSSELNRVSNIPVNPDGSIPFAKGGVHPYLDTGHRLYMAAIARSMDKIKEVGTVGPHHIPDAMGANLERADLYPLSKAKFSRNGWKKLDGKSKIHRYFNRKLPEVWQAIPGAELNFDFKGTQVAIYDVVGPDCGEVEVSIDGRKKKVARMDKYCSYHRISRLWIGSNLPDKVHHVTVKVLDFKVDKAKIFAGRPKNLADRKKHPDKYSGHNWYAGGIMVIGNIE